MGAGDGEIAASKEKGSGGAGGVGVERTSLDGVRDKNVMQLKKLNTALFPVRYNEKYYQDAIASKDFSKLACHLEKKEGGAIRVYIMTLGVLVPYRGLGIGHRISCLVGTIIVVIPSYLLRLLAFSYWHRYYKRKMAEQRRKEEEAASQPSSSHPSLRATIYASRFAANAMREVHRLRSKAVPTIVRLPKPPEPDFGVDDAN